MHSELSRFEAELLQVEQLVRDSESQATVFPAAAKALRSLAKVAGCSVWLTGPSGSRRLIQEGECSHDNPKTLATLQSFLQDPATAQTIPADSLPQVQHGPTLLAATNLVPHERLVLEVRLAADAQPSRLLTEAAAAVVDCLADLYRRVLLTDAKRQLSIRSSLAGTTHLLYQQTSDADRAVVLVNEVRAAVQLDRVSLLTRDRGQRWTLVAASGVETVEREAYSGQSIQNAVKDLLADHQQRRWVNVTSETAANRESLRGLNLHGTQQVYLLPLGDETAVTDAPQSSHVLLLESFSADTPDAESISELARQVPLLLTNCFRQPQHAWQKRVLRKSVVLTFVLALLTILLLWQRDFELEVTGQAFPEHRIRVFAPADGVIESLSVDNQTAVAAGTELLRLRDEDLELELQRTLGHLQTEETRLAALKRSRTLQAQDDRGLPASEAASEQRIDDLKKQLALLETQRLRLTLKASVAGTTLRSNLRDELLSRPVRRGQILFEIVRSDAPWQVELQIPDRFVGYVRQAMLDSQTPRVRFFSRLTPETQLTSALQHVDDYVQERDRVWFCRGYMPVPDDAVADFTVGTSVTARIYCGRTTTAFILFREVFELGRELWFDWM